MENFGQENIKEKSKEDLEKGISFLIGEIKNFSKENKEEWMNNFSKNLSEIKNIFKTEEAISLFPASIIESVLLRISVLEINLDSVKEDLSKNDWLQVKNLLLDDLEKLMN
jgi:hypothetical protein